MSAMRMSLTFHDEQPRDTGRSAPYRCRWGMRAGVTRGGVSWNRSSSERQRSRRILIAEDHVGVRSVMARLLQFEGYEVHEARHGLDVLAILARDQLRTCSCSTCRCLAWMGNWS